jgi:glycerol-3-phosphate O-acyltransferase
LAALEFWSQLHDMNYYITFGAQIHDKDMTEQLLDHIQCTRKHDKDTTVHFDRLGGTRCTPTYKSRTYMSRQMLAEHRRRFTPKNRPRTTEDTKR